MIKIKQKGDLKKTTNYLDRVSKMKVDEIFDKYGRKGVQALSSATPYDTGNTASSWYYEKEIGDGYARLYFANSNMNKGVSIATILQYGHGTGTGGWVEGRDYINPALKPIYDEMEEELYREATKD